MKARNKENVARSERTLSARSGREETERDGGLKTSPASRGRDDADHSAATWKSYADSRLRQFCLR